jgi:DNA repair photolyase
MEAVLERAAEAGATSAMYVTLRLPLEIKDLFREWLEAERPDRAGRVMSLVRQMRGGRDYDPQWGSRMTGQGAYAELIAKRFNVACSRLKLNVERKPLRTDLFRIPPVEKAQLELFS